MISDAKEVNENKNETEKKSFFSWTSLNMHRPPLIKTTFISKIPNMNNKENSTVALGQGIIPVSILSDQFWEEQELLYLLPEGNFLFNACWDITISYTQ